MADTKSKAALLTELQTERARWEAILAEVGPERMTTPGVEGEWSVKDVIAHVTYYERVVRDRLLASLAGSEFVRPAYEAPQGLSIDDRNAWIYARINALPLDEVLREAHEVYPPLLAAVQTLTEADLNDPAHFPWQNGSAVWEWVEGDITEHYRDHIANIRAWLDGQA
jgi:Protein of unknown function (DUF1706)